MRSSLQQALIVDRAEPCLLDPTSITGCTLWLDSSYGITDAGGGAVSSWLDLSGVGNHFTQAVAANRPTRLLNQLGCFPAIDLDGTDDFLLTAGGSGVFITAAAWTGFFLARTDAINTNATGASVFTNDMIFGDTGGNWGVMLTSGPPTQVRNYSFDVNADNVPADIVLSRFQLIEVRHDTGNLFARVADGVEQGPVASGNVAIAGTPRIGQTFAAAPDEFWDGALVSALVYNTAVSAANRLLIRQYFRQRFGVLV